jgi:hypothetical protein
MSAPPRSTLTVRPFRAAGTEPGQPPSNWGLAWYARVDFDACVKGRWPGWPGGLEGSARRRLHAAVALLRPCHPAALAGVPDETLTDELLRRADSIEGHLPPLLMATPTSPEPRLLEPDPLRALAVLTHLSGHTCDPGGSSLYSEALRAGRALDLWIPEPAHA